MKVGLDTNVFLNVKNKEKPFFQYSNAILTTIDNSEIEAIVSIVTIAELCVGYYNTNELNEKDEFINGLYSNQNYQIVDLNLKVAEKSGEIKNATRLKLPDSIIIASCILEQASCVITNDARFDNAKDLIPILSSKEFFDKYLEKPKKGK